MKTHKNQPKILVAPLNWGLGHATRCMPIIERLLKRDVEVMIASDGRSLQLLRTEYPQLTCVELPAYSISYGSKKSGLVRSMFGQLPKIFWQIYQEHRALQQLVQKHQIDVVISDNRFGCWSQQAYTVFMTHQVFVQLPPQIKFLQSPLLRLNYWFINKYNACWIPDYPNKADSISGILAHQSPLDLKHFRFIGLLSRMQNMAQKTLAPLPPHLQKTYDVLIVLSGPEPQRTVFEQMILQQIEDVPDDKQLLIVRGVTEQKAHQELRANVHIIDFLTAEDLYQVLMNAGLVIARSGYSTIMDLLALKKRAVLVPTPEQTEQEYLAQYFHNKAYFNFVLQNNFDLKSIIAKELHFEIPLIEEDDLLEIALEELLNAKQKENLA